VRRFKSCPIHRENTLTSKSDPKNGGSWQRLQVRSVR